VHVGFDYVKVSRMKMVVVGLGYLGVTHAVAMAKLGHDVVGVDVDDVRVSLLSSGVLPFYEPGLDEALVEMLDTERLSFVSDYSDVMLDADIFWLCVGTPQVEGSLQADVSFVVDALKRVCAFVVKDVVVVGKSTVPVGTHKILYKVVEEFSKPGVNVSLVWNPEFLREGTALEDSLHPDRIVVGVEPGDEHSVDVMREVYTPVLDSGVPFIVSDLPTAELVKVAANSFLATKISFINMMAEMSEASGADVVKLAEAIGYDERIGKKFLKSGVGFGGGCLPKDIRGFIASAESLGVNSVPSLMGTVDDINMGRRSKVVDMAVDLCDGDVAGKKIAILGASFKPDSDDVRDSPALAIALKLSELGANIVIHDPKALPAVSRKHPELITQENLNFVFHNADLVIHLTEWKQYRNINPAEHVNVVNTPVIIDGRNALDVNLWREAGWRIIGLGRNL
jgi:UDPglucose 6-dehydrogenase